MGLARGAIALLLDEARERPFSGTVATLGKQTILIDGRELRALFDRYGVEMQGPASEKRKTIDDKDVLLALGFSDVHSIDYSDYEGATDVLDLNTAELPNDHHERYDVVLDSGTIEHVFHIPNALKHIFHMLKPGGRVIFLSPSSNHMDHGFYMFSPTFFYDYYSANGFTIEKACIVRYDVNLARLWEVYDYIPGTWQDLSLGGLDQNPYAIFFVATKGPSACWNVVPQQNYYSRTSAAYVGSHLATGDSPASSSTPSAQAALATTSSSEVTATPPPVAAVATTPPFPHLRAIAKHIPGTRKAYRMVRRGQAVLSMWTSGKNKSEMGPYILHRKPLRGRF